MDARDAGDGGGPAKDLVPSANRAVVDAELSAALDRVRDRQLARQSAALQAVAGARARLEPAAPGELAASARTAVAALRSQAAPGIAEAERLAEVAARDLALFRDRHGLARAPRPPGDKAGSVVLLTGVFLLLTGVLALAAGDFHSPTSVWSSAATQAAGLTAFALLTGAFGFRFAFHRGRALWRLLGGAASLLGVAGGLALTGLLAYRMLGAPETAAGLAASTTALAVAGVAATAFVGIAALARRGLFEPYPGYGHVAGRFERARARLAALRTKLAADAGRAVADAEADLDAEIDADRDAVAALRAAVADLDLAAQEAADAAAELAQRARRMGAGPPAFDAAPPSAVAARNALADAEARLAANEAAHAEQVSRLADLLGELERDLADPDSRDAPRADPG